MKTETLRVLIVAKTRRKGGACIGAIATDGRSLRLQAANAESDDHTGMDYQVGDVWEVQAGPHPEIEPPHVETVVVYGRRLVRRHVDPVPIIERFMPPAAGGPEVLYGGVLQANDSGSLYVAEQAGIPERSTMFWRPDRPLRLATNGVRLHYVYESNEGERRLTFVGFQEPSEEIPAGAIVRVSLAHWWRPANQPGEELRCYVQLSGWFVPGEAGANEAQGHARSNPANPSTAAIAAQISREQMWESLREVFGYSSFLPLQEEIITALAERKDVLAVMPTGAGKSLCYQLPALLWPRMTVVVSPLIALMQDQVEALHELGVAAALLNSSLNYGEQRSVMERVREQRVRLLYVAPETLVRPEVLYLLDQAGVDCLAVDEAHCISAWGHDFRPEYRQLEPVRRRFADAICLAMTATAAPRVRADIKHSLGMDHAREFVASFDRPNLFLAAEPRSNGLRQLLAFLQQHREQPGIVYCSARRQVDTLAEQLQKQGYQAVPYHAGLDDATRKRHQHAFVHDEAQIIVATVAFGMGINKSNVRYVVHYNMPPSLEAYYQEIGRSGRDGVRADCLLLYSAQDVQLQLRLIDEGAEEERPGRNARLQAMLRFAQAHSCRRPLLLRYFGEEPEVDGCGFCDNCVSETSEQPQSDVTPAAQKFFGCMLDTRELFGAGHLIDILRGSRSQKVQERGHERLPAYSSGKEYSARQWRDLVQQWLLQGLLEQDMEHGGLRLTQHGREVQRGHRQAFAVFPQHDPGEAMALPASGRQGAQVPAEYDTGLFEHLRALRRGLAAAGNVPPYVVFSERALIEMAAYLPQSPEEFVTINGVGRRKLESYGEAFLAAIRRYCAEHEVQRQPRPQPGGRTVPADPAPQEQCATRRDIEIGQLYGEGQSLAEMQTLYGIKRSRVVNHLRQYAACGGAVDDRRLQAECTLPQTVQEKVFAAFAELGSLRLTPVYEALEGAVGYEDLHLLRVVWLLRSPTATRTL